MVASVATPPQDAHHCGVTWSPSVSGYLVYAALATVLSYLSVLPNLPQLGDVVLFALAVCAIITGLALATWDHQRESAMPTSTATTASRVEKIRSQISKDAPGITREIQEAASECQGSEARFRTRFAFTIESWARGLNIPFIPFIVQEERSLVTGRVDATYNRLIIEYEAPGRLRDDPSHGATAHAIQQAKDYVEGVARAERQRVHRLVGVALDGCYFIYVRKIHGHWTEPEIEPVHEHSAGRFLRLLVSLVSGKALVPDNLVQDFGSNTLTTQQIARPLYRALCRVLDDDTEDLVDKLFEQWQTFFGEVTGYEEGSRPLRNKPELRAFARGLGIDPRGAVDPPRLFFTVHTYYALLIKLIAFYALSRFVSGFGARFGSLYQLPDDELKREMEELERGGIFRTLGIRNFLEGDFFKWYLTAWDADVAHAVRLLFDRLKDYDPGTLEVSPEQARDLLKKLYHRLMPREIRHDLGEYYTPDWLAEDVLNEVGYEDQTDKRLLDPACGSGTFLVLAQAASRALYARGPQRAGNAGDDLQQHRGHRPEPAGGGGSADQLPAGPGPRYSPSLQQTRT
ncbi:MAG TPA: SAM-dependent DNA methyltransferase [Anaerolineae bacterium]|nr:SAM-dependent DNA methyltransferase [Anaerolineae bacterium]